MGTPPPPVRLPATRRSWLRVLGALPLVPAFAASGAPVDGGNEPIVQPRSADRQAFMDRAFQMRRRAEEAGEQPYGAVIVQADRIVGQAPSAVITRRDPTAHAEIEAIRDAARRLGSHDLSGSVLYSSSRPCPMCEAAAYWAGIERMVHGTELADAGPPRLR
jgi:tRNA(Arg) A34 adenosine deaminase TadA